MTWSYSSLNAWEQCPRRYHLTRIAKVISEPQTEATLHGNEVHKALENAVGKALPGGLEKVIQQQTAALAKAIAESSAFSIAGGGDTLAAIAKFHIADDIGYISTGGGAFLEVLEGKTLPAIEALQARANG